MARNTTFDREDVILAAMSVLEAEGARAEAKPGDLLLFVADQPATVAEALSHLRLELAHHRHALERGLC